MARYNVLTRTAVEKYDDEYSMRRELDHIELERANLHILPSRRVSIIVRNNQRTLMPFHLTTQYFDDL